MNAERGVGQVADNRPPALGLGRLVMVLYWLFGAWVCIESVIELFNREPGQAIGPALGSLLAGMVHLLAAVAISHNGRRMRMVGWTCVIIGLWAPIVVGVVGWGIPEVTAQKSARGSFGEDYLFLPVVVNIVGLVWLWWSNPRRIVEIAEQVERPSRSWR